MKTNTKIFSAIFILSFLMAVTTYSQVRLPKLISDGMVLQRDSEIKIWGWASDSENISIHFNDSAYNTTADKIGEWNITLPKLDAGGPYEMRINASNEIIIKDIMIGDVWICSGQSNMELPMNRVSWIYSDEIENSENKFIRQFYVPQKYNFKDAQKDFEYGSWKKANPNNVLEFSAVAYFLQKIFMKSIKSPSA